MWRFLSILASLLLHLGLYIHARREGRKAATAEKDAADLEALRKVNHAREHLRRDPALRQRLRQRYKR